MAKRAPVGKSSKGCKFLKRLVAGARYSRTDLLMEEVFTATVK